MKTITLKGIPDMLYRALKRRAEANRRSLNSEVLVALERAVGTRAAEESSTTSKRRGRPS